MTVHPENLIPISMSGSTLGSKLID